ncbi:hypothetical protein BYT27DRAFT_7198778 [Phlegmacium glaucopus]|nr:hypothetical protein BYT27DRAFT_7198778 [Phlegmacium glaucopus]
MGPDHDMETPGACTPGPLGEDRLDHVTADLADGFYKIYQEIENNTAFVSVKWPDQELSSGDYALVNMVPTKTQAASNSEFYFKLTRQHGVKNGFTIVPASSRIPEGVPASGTTTFPIGDGLLSVGRSFKYPVWSIQCFQSNITRDRKDKNKITIVNRFQILELEVGSTRRWVSMPWPNNLLIVVRSPGSAVTDHELFQFIREDEIL